MKKTIKYTDGEIGSVKIIEDFLPSPEELVFKGEAKKRSSVFGLLKGRMVDPVKWQRILREENNRGIYNGK